MITTARITELALTGNAIVANIDADLEKAITTAVHESLAASYADVSNAKKALSAAGQITDGAQEIAIPNDGSKVICRVPITQARIDSLISGIAGSATLMEKRQLACIVAQAVEEALEWSFNDTKVDLSENAGSNVVKADNSLKTVAPDVITPAEARAVLVAPTVTSCSPATGTTAGGTSVTITGAHFLEVLGVTFGGEAATDLVVVSPTSITCKTPANDAGAVSVVVTSRYGANAANTAFTFEAPGP